MKVRFAIILCLFLFASPVLSGTLIDDFGDGDLDGWQPMRDMPTARGALFTAVCNERIYAFGGGLADETRVSNVEEYDPVTDTWREMEPMPIPQWFSVACEVNDNIFVFGGTTKNGVFITSVYKFDPLIDEWEKVADAPEAIPAVSL